MAGVPLLDFSPIGQLYQTYQQGQQQRQTQDWLQQQGLPGSLPLAQLALANRRDERDFGLRKDEITRNQSNADRAYALQKEQADAAARGYDYREIDDGQGGKKLVRIEKATGAVSAPPIAGVQDTPNNPFAQGKMTDEQSKAGLYSSRMMSAEKILRDPAITTAALQPKEHMIGRVAGMGGITGMIGNSLLGAEYQKYDQAKRDFINAVLRRESGAVISDSEFLNAEKQYFPQPGDTQERLTQKQANRAEAIRGIAAGAGPGYRPNNIFDDKGNIIDNPAPKRGEQKAATAKPIADKAAYDALPPGTPYIAPDGSQRVKR